MSAERPPIADDGLATPVVGAWADKKYRLLYNYAATFARSMQAKWDCRVYIDLFSGSGRARIEGSNRIVDASPLLALSVAAPFNRYIFCERDGNLLEALAKRVAKTAPGAEACLIPGDVNESVSEILQAIPRHNKSTKVLSFCFVDPFNVGNLRFETLRSLSKRFVDFLVLIPSFMDINRNQHIYSERSSRCLDNFLGTETWRNSWSAAESRVMKFGTFIADQFGKQMASLGYLYDGMSDMVEIRSDDKNLPLYHLAFFSRHKLGPHFWKEAIKYSDDQMRLFG